MQLRRCTAVNEGDNRSIYDSRLINNGKVDLNDLQNNFYQTLEAEKAALKQGIIKPDDEISVLPPREAQEWYQDRVEGLMEDADSPDELKSALDALGPEPGDNEAVFLGEDGGRILPEFSLNVTQENTPINVPYKERNEAKALGAKWDRTEQTWFVPKGVSLDKFAKWVGGPTAENNSSVVSVKEVTPKVGERQNLAVPYKDRAEAKAAGAKWDKEKKLGMPKLGQICKNWRSGNRKMW